MWKNKNKQPNPAQYTTTLLSKHTDIIGDIRFNGELEIQGLVRGTVTAIDQRQSLVRVVEGGRVEGDIHAPRVMINGHVKGNLYATGTVELASKAHIEGSVHYQQLEMAKGAQINGSLVHIDNQQEPSAAKKATGPSNIARETQPKPNTTTKTATRTTTPNKAS